MLPSCYVILWGPFECCLCTWIVWSTKLCLLSLGGSSWANEFLGAIGCHVSCGCWDNSYQDMETAKSRLVGWEELMFGSLYLWRVQFLKCRFIHVGCPSIDLTGFYVKRVVVHGNLPLWKDGFSGLEIYICNLLRT